MPARRRAWYSGWFSRSRLPSGSRSRLPSGTLVSPTERQQLPPGRRDPLDAELMSHMSNCQTPLPLLITGIAGVPGYNALHYFQAKYPGQVFGIRQADNARLTGPGVVACNAEDREGLARLFDQHRFAAVLNCAGNCALKACELDPALAWRINVEGVRNLLSQTVPRGLRLVHLSVDLVFSGERDGGYVEDDPTDPVTVYGKTMVAGEQVVRKMDPAACILRISLPMGISFNGHAGAIDWISSRFKKSPPGDALLRRGPHAHLHRLPEPCCARRCWAAGWRGCSMPAGRDG